MPRPSNSTLQEDAELAKAGKAKCRMCGEVKAQTEFGKSAQTRSGLQANCKPCTNSRNLEYHRKYRNKDPEGYAKRKLEQRRKWRERKLREDPEGLRRLEREHNLRNNYGITTHQFNTLLAEQDGRCAICMTPKPQRKWHVDHDHRTGVVRGILCNLCNVAIGAFHDDPERMKAAALYVRS